MLGISSLPVLSFADDTAGPIEKKIVIKEKIPEGLTIKTDQVTLKDGFAFERVNPNHVNVIPSKSGANAEVTGSIECSCNGTNEGCEVIISQNHVTCGTTSCKSMCYMMVTSRNKETLEISK